MESFLINLQIGTFMFTSAIFILVFNYFTIALPHCCNMKPRKFPYNQTKISYSNKYNSFKITKYNLWTFRKKIDS